MKVERTIELGNGHKIEFGKASWDENVVSIRNRYPTKNNRFSPRSSSEISIADVKILVKESVINGYFPNNELLEIVEFCVSTLKSNSDDKKYLSQNDKISKMRLASVDSLYLNDIKEISDDFEAVDNEI